MPDQPLASRIPWIFSPAIDLMAFGGSALLSMTFLAIGVGWGFWEQETPEWFWITGILMVDVAHVWATLFRVGFSLEELRRRAWLYGLTPCMAWLIGAALYSENPSWFWRCLAYLAVFHFVRQQYGWVAWYRSKGKETGRLGAVIDVGAIYLATLYPLVYWHGNLPRAFWWFLADDFVSLPPELALWLWPFYVLSLSVYVVRSLARGWVHNQWSPGKDVVVISTAACWYSGIVAFNSDFAFAVTNVLIHGIPYLVLVFWYDEHKGSRKLAPNYWPVRLIRFAAIVWALAYVEELLWHRSLWHERAWMFGDSWSLDRYAAWLVPLLAVPQISHYVLDGFLWRRGSNSHVRKMIDDGREEMPEGF